MSFQCYRPYRWSYADDQRDDNTRNYTWKSARERRNIPFYFIIDEYFFLLLFRKRDRERERDFNRIIWGQEWRFARRILMGPRKVAITNFWWKLTRCRNLTNYVLIGSPDFIARKTFPCREEGGGGQSTVSSSGTIIPPPSPLFLGTLGLYRWIEC